MESLAKKFDFCEEDLELDFNQLAHIQIILRSSGYAPAPVSLVIPIWAD
jgi:hypothetical protein